MVGEEDVGENPPIIPETPVEAQVPFIQETSPLINPIYPQFGDGLPQQYQPRISVPLSSAVPLENVTTELNEESNGYERSDLNSIN